MLGIAFFITLIRHVVYQGYIKTKSSSHFNYIIHDRINFQALIICHLTNLICSAGGLQAEPIFPSIVVQSVKHNCFFKGQIISE